MQSPLDRLIYSEYGGRISVKLPNDKETRLNDIRKLPGTNLLDWRFDQYLKHQYGTQNGERYEADKTNLLQYWLYMKISVYDSASAYTLAPGTLYTEEERTITIFQKEKYVPNLRGDLIYGFYHKLTSTHESVGPGGNQHTSYFYFKVGESGELCPSDPIDSLSSDLGIEWLYVKVERDMWTEDMVFTIRTNLMTSDCVHTYPTSSLNFNNPGGLTQVGSGKDYIEGKPRVFYYQFKLLKEGTGGDIFIAEDTKGKFHFSKC